MFLKSFGYICLLLQFVGGFCFASDIDERLNRSDVYLNVNKNSDTLELVAKTGGSEVFKTQVKDVDFSTFSGSVSKNFQVRRLAEGLLFQYRAPDLGELFDLLVSQNGDVELLHGNHTYTGWDKRRSYGIKSSGVIRNRGAQAFYSLALYGDQIHNFGSIQSYDMHLCQHYLFNSGVLVFGEKAKGAYDLSTKFLTDKSAVPAYKAHTIENYGTIKANGKLNIKSSLSYHEYGSSDFEDLETSGGDFNLQKGGRVIVSGKFGGTVRDVSVGSNSGLLVDSFCFSQVNNFSIGEKGRFHSVNSWNLSVNGTYANSGELACGGDFHLHLNNLPSAGQSGNVVARGKLTYSYVLNDRPKNWEKAPRITGDQACLNVLMQYNEHTLPQGLLDKLEKEFYKRVGFDPEFEENQSTLSALRAPGRLISRIRTVTTYTDHYLNTITYHYVTTVDENGISHTRLDHISETGYIWTGRTSSTHTEEIPQAQKLDKLYDLLKGDMGRAKWWNNNQLRLAQVLAEQAAKQRAAEMNQRFLEALRKALLGLDPGDPDVRAILENDYIKNLLSSLHNYDTPGAPLTPEVKALRQLDAEASSDLSWWKKFFNPTFDLDAQRFELSPLGSFLLEHPEFLLGPASLARQAVKTAACIALQRVAPKLLAASGAALAWENFVSFMKDGKNAVKKTTAGEAKPRLGTSRYKDGGFWGGLYDNARGLQSAGIKSKKAQEMYGDYKHLKRIDRGGEIRMDKDGNFYKYDRAHQSANIHLEKIVKKSNGFYNVAKVDPETGKILEILNRFVGK